MEIKLRFSRGKLEAKIIEDFKKSIDYYLDNYITELECLFTEKIHGRNYDFGFIYHPEAKEVYKEIYCYLGKNIVKLTLVNYNQNPNAETLYKKLEKIIDYAENEKLDINEAARNIADDQQYHKHL